MQSEEPPILDSSETATESKDTVDAMNKTTSSFQTAETAVTTASAEQTESQETHSQSLEQELVKAFKGLQNQGATCYMNSLLQSLFMTPDFRRMIYKWRYDETINPSKKDCIIYQLQKLFAALQCSKAPFAMTNELTGSFQWDYSQSFEQQDVQEFMRVLFDAIEQSFEINNIFGVVEEIYAGEGQDFLKCHSCGYSSKNKSKFYDLQLPVKNEFEQKQNGSIEQALFGYLKPEILEGDNAYQCSGCGQKVTASKGYSLERLPKILTLQLQRFTLDMHTWQWQRKKLNDRVTFPLILNMNHFLNKEKQSDWSQTEKLIKENPLGDVRPAQFRAQCMQAAQKEAVESIEKAKKNDTEARFEANMARELGEFDETNLAPQAKGKLAEQRRADQARVQQEHKEKLKQLKQKTKPKTKKRPGGFDKSNINSNFFNNAKSNKDAVQGWAFDFENPDAGTGGMRAEEDAIIQQVMKDSLRDTPKSEKALKTDEQIGADGGAQSRSADQVAKEESKVIKADLEDVINPLDSTSTAGLTKEQLLAQIQSKCAELKQQYLTEGNFVYDLYAIMIHSGSAFGGHYYAYIKDLETGLWYNFNDSSVRQISVLDVIEMFGPEPPSKKGFAAKRIAGTHSANAYMLMYRIIDPNEEIGNLQVHEDEIPQEVMEDMKSSEIKHKEVKLVQDKKSQLMQLKVVHYPPKEVLLQDNLEDSLQTKVFYVDRREDTYTTFFDKVYKDFIGDQTTKDRTNFRLRAYNVQYRIMLDTYTGRDNDSLEVLKIYPMKTLAFEEKLPHETFDDYDPSQMVVKVNLWRADIQSLSEDVLKPRQLKVHKDTVMKDFVALLSKETGIAEQNVVVMKRNPMLNTKCMEVLSDNLEKRMNQLRVNEGVNLFIEDGSVPIPESLNQFNADEFDDPAVLAESVKPTKWEKEFELESNRFQVKFNDPTLTFVADQTALTAEQKALDSQKNLYTCFIIADRRISVLDLKIKICDMFQIDLGSLVFRRGGAHGTELVEDELTLKQAQFYNMICIYTEKGIPSQVGQKRLKFFFSEFTSTTNMADLQLHLQPDADNVAPVALPDHCFFQFKELLEIPVKTSQKVGVIKSQIVKRIDDAFPNLGLSLLDPTRIRLREKSGEDKLTQVYHSSRELSRYQVYDGKEVAIQIVENQTSGNQGALEEECYLILVKLWDQSNWTLSQAVELFVPKLATLDVLADQLVGQFPKIDKKSIQCTKINSSWNFSRVQLPFESWQSLQGSTDFFSAAPFYVSTDGILFIVKDGSVPEREMTAEEKELYRSDDFEAHTFGSGGGIPNTTSKRSNKGPKEKGVKIKVKGISPKHGAEQAVELESNQAVIVTKQETSGETHEMNDESQNNLNEQK